VNIEDLRIVTRAHVIAWRDTLLARKRADATIRRALSALSSLLMYLCNANAVTYNPVTGVERPSEGANEGRTPALGDAQARALLEAPAGDTVKDKRDRAMLSTLLYHGLRREELCNLRVWDMTQRRGVLHLRVHGKGGKTRYLPLHPGTAEVITEYVEAVGYGGDPSSPLFRPVRNNLTGKLSEPMTTDGVYKMVQYYIRKAGIGDIERLGVHALRATAATNALDHEADIAKVSSSKFTTLASAAGPVIIKALVPR
jgi:integrase/recombinase XerD